MSGRVELPNKYVGETKTVTFDFSDSLAIGETISTQACTVTTYSGTDTNPGNMLNGTASPSGGVVSQSIKAGVVGAIYSVMCKITTSAGQTLQKVGFMAVLPDAL